MPRDATSARGDIELSRFSGAAQGQRFIAASHYPFVPYMLR